MLPIYTYGGWYISVVIPKSQILVYYGTRESCLVAKVKNMALACSLKFPAERAGYKIAITRFLEKYEIY